MVQATQTGEPEHKPDYSAFEGTRPVNERQRFDLDALAAWLAQHVDGFSRPLALEQFAGGQSNPDVQTGHAVALVCDARKARSRRETAAVRARRRT